MAIVFENLGASANPDINSTADATTYTNNSWTPPTSGLLIVYVHNQAATSGAAIVPTLSGNGLTWQAIRNRAGGVNRISLFAADLSGATTGVTTVSYGANTQLACRASFFRATNVDLAGGVEAAFVQTVVDGGSSGTTASLIMAAASHADNRAIAAFYHGANEAIVSGWTEMDMMLETQPSVALASQAKADAFATTATASWSTVNAWGGIAAELKAAAETAPTYAELSGTSTGTASTSAALSITSTLTGQSAGVASATANVTLTAQLTGSSAGQASTAADLATIAQLGGTSAGIATVTGQLSATASLAGQSAGIATTTATLSTGTYAELTGSAAGQASATGNVTLVSHLTGSAAGSSSVVGNLIVALILSGVAAGSATTVASLSVTSASDNLPRITYSAEVQINFVVSASVAVL